MIAWISIYIFASVSLVSVWGHHDGHAHFYTAAVFEHARLGKLNDSAEDVVRWNLDMYWKATEIAITKHADIILFPEYGIFPPGDRPFLKKYLENIPDPRTVDANPCQEQEEYSTRPILLSLSCMAKNNSIVVVANVGDIQTCEGDPQCPEDGAFHFNTNVVFDKDGKLILKYHKEHLYFEFGMDLAREQQDPTFETEFGKFATYICFDIIFERMSRVAQRPDVDAVLFSTMWLDSGPQFTSVQFFQGWAMGNNATLLASNIQLPGYFSVGSGIFDGPDGALAYTYNPDGISKLIVSKVPRLGHRHHHHLDPADVSTIAITPEKSWIFNNNFKDVPQVCSRTLLNDTEDIYTDYRCVEEVTTNYTFVQLTEASDHVEACNNGMCCTLDYTADGIPENFYLGVYNGTGSHNAFGRYFWAEENCVLVTCDAVGDNPCATFPMKSNSSFQQVQLRANFTTNFVYPSVVESSMMLVPKNEWNYNLPSVGSPEATINFKSQEGRKLIAVGFKGRCYDRDPPYVR